MYSVLIVVGLFAIIGVASALASRSLEMVVPVTIALAIVGLFVGLAAVLIISFFLPITTDMILVDCKTLAGVQDVNGVYGSFFLGCGEVNGELVYRYFEKIGANSYRPAEIRTPCDSRVEIVEKDDLKIGFLEIWQTTTSLHNPKLKNWFFNLGGGSKLVKFIVPKGSVVRQFRFDLQ